MQVKFLVPRTKWVFTNRQFSIFTKIKIFRALVRPVLLYGCETWSVTQANLQCCKYIPHEVNSINSLVSRDRIKSRIQII